MGSSSESNRLRQRGNEYYSRATAPAASPEERAKLLPVARDLYKNALQHAATSNDLASLHKNLGATMAQLAAVEDSTARVQLLVQSVQHKCQAYLQGQVARKEQAWLASAWDSIDSCLKSITQALLSVLEQDTKLSSAALQLLQQLHINIPEHLRLWRLHASHDFLTVVKAAATQWLSSNGGARGGGGHAPQWRACLELLAEAKRPMQEALKLAQELGRERELQALQSLKEDLFALECRAESTQARLQADEVLARTIRMQDERQNNMEKSYRRRVSSAAGSAAADACLQEGFLTAIDLYKQAALLAKEKDLQAEAQAMSRLGCLYKEAASSLDATLLSGSLQLSRSADERSREAYMRVLLLVDAIPYRINLMAEEWYTEARDSISAHQASNAGEEEREREAERDKVKKELEPELKAIYAAAYKGWVELLKHCYKEHAPLNPANRLAADTVFSADTGKELLRKAIVAYHPDKQGGGQVPLRWKVLAEEITKQLNFKYRDFK